MCTAITLTSEASTTYFGRNLDFSFATDAHLIAIDAGATWENPLDGRTETDRFALLGLGQFGTGYPVFLDGVNECGLAGGALYFPGYADYPAPDAEEVRTAGVPAYEALDLVRVLLASCDSVAAVRHAMGGLRVVGVPNSVTHQVTPMHWIFCDRSGACVVIEVMAGEDGQVRQFVRDDPAGVLTNSPDLPWHLANLRNYLHVSAKQPKATTWSDVELSPFGQGVGTSGLPAGYSPVARFVRTAFVRSTIKVPAQEDEAVAACFHALEPVALPRGCALDPSGAADVTQYTAFASTSTGDYWVRTYDCPVVRHLAWADAFGTTAKDEAGPAARDLGSINRPMPYAEFPLGR